MASPKTEETPKRVEVTLIAPHEHRGQPHDAGDKIEVTERQAEWLKQQGKIE